MGIGQDDVYPFHLAHAPGAFAGTPGGYGIGTGNAPFEQLGHVGTAVLPWSTHSTFVSVHLQPQSLFDKAADAFHYSIPCPLAPDEDDTVIGIADKAKATLTRAFASGLLQARIAATPS